jgi:hypothetical protein
MARKFLAFAILLWAATGVVVPASAQLGGPSGMRFVTRQSHRLLTLAALRCPPGQQLDPRQNRCVAPAAPPPVAPAAPPPATGPAACQASEIWDTRLNSCVPSVAPDGPAIPRKIPGDPLSH